MNEYEYICLSSDVFLSKSLHHEKQCSVFEARKANVA